MPDPTAPQSAPAPAAKAAAPAPSPAAATTSKAAPPAPSEPGGVTLVEVRKDGESLRVHPTTVAAHVAAGWRVAKATH